MAACGQPRSRITAVAARFCVSKSFIDKLLHRNRTQQTLAPLPLSGGVKSVFTPAADQALLACLAAQPDATLEELRVQLAVVGGPIVSRTTLCQQVQKLGWRRKKKSVHATERDTEHNRESRRLFLEALQQEDVTRFKFFDETGSNLAYCRRYGRAPHGQRVGQAVPLKAGPNRSILATLTPNGLEAVMSVEGAVNTAVMVVYLRDVLGPTLQQGDVLVLDNLSAHHASELVPLVKARGARLLFLPSYSPDFNPIELAFSKLKTWLRTAKARTAQVLEDAIRDAIEWISPEDAKNWFAHCGYHVH